MFVFFKANIPHICKTREQHAGCDDEVCTHKFTLGQSSTSIELPNTRDQPYAQPKTQSPTTHTHTMSTHKNEGHIHKLCRKDIRAQIYKQPQANNVFHFLVAAAHIMCPTGHPQSATPTYCPSPSPRNARACAKPLTCRFVVERMTLWSSLSSSLEHICSARSPPTPPPKTLWYVPF